MVFETYENPFTRIMFSTFNSVSTAHNEVKLHAATHWWMYRQPRGPEQGQEAEYKSGLSAEYQILPPEI